jgi:hypothetical protein
VGHVQEGRLVLVQTLQQIERTFLDEIDRFELPDPTGCVGIPWSSDRYREEIAKMRECLISPYWCIVMAGNQAGFVGCPYDGNAKHFVALAKDEDDYYLFFDPENQLYALGFEHEGTLSSFLYGDAVSTFLSR